MSGGGLFDSLDYSFTPGHEDGTDIAPNGPGGGSPALRRGLRILSEFLRGLPLESLSVDTVTVAHASGVSARVLSSAKTGVYAMYLDGAGPASLMLQLSKGTYGVQWIDPLTGKALREEELPSRPRFTIDSPPFEKGIAVKISRKP